MTISQSKLAHNGYLHQKADSNLTSMHPFTQTQTRQVMVFVLRDHRGKQIAAQSNSSFGVQQPAVAECIVLRKALSWLKLKGYSHVDIETDYLPVASYCQHHYLPSTNSSLLHLVLEDCKFVFEQLLDVSISYNPRFENHVAHTLAQATGFMLDISNWGSNSPSFLYVVLAIEFID